MFILRKCLFVCSLSIFLTGSTFAKVVQPQAVEAALNGSTKVIQQALSEGYKVDMIDNQGRTLLMYAAFNGNTDIVDLLLKAGADIDFQDSMGSTALMFAASGPAKETVTLLLKNQAKINLVDNNEHFSALMWAAAEGQLDNVKVLINNGADTTLQDVDGDTAESFADKAGHTEVVAYLQSIKKEQTAE